MALLTKRICRGHHVRMKQIVSPEVVALQARMFAYRLKLPDVLKRAGVHRSSWWRWSRGGDVRMKSLGAVREAIDAMIAEGHQADTAGVDAPRFPPAQAASVDPSMTDAAGQ